MTPCKHFRQYFIVPNSNLQYGIANLSRLSRPFYRDCNLRSKPEFPFCLLLSFSKLYGSMNCIFIKFVVRFAPKSTMSVNRRNGVQLRHSLYGQGRGGSEEPPQANCKLGLSLSMPLSHIIPRMPVNLNSSSSSSYILAAVFSLIT